MTLIESLAKNSAALHITSFIDLFIHELIHSNDMC
jgi:hypothetical protein